MRVKPGLLWSISHAEAAERLSLLQGAVQSSLGCASQEGEGEHHPSFLFFFFSLPSPLPMKNVSHLPEKCSQFLQLDIGFFWLPFWIPSGGIWQCPIMIWGSQWVVCLPKYISNMRGGLTILHCLTSYIVLHNCVSLLKYIKQIIMTLKLCMTTSRLNSSLMSSTVISLKNVELSIYTIWSLLFHVIWSMIFTILCDCFLYLSWNRVFVIVLFATLEKPVCFPILFWNLINSFMNG